MYAYAPLCTCVLTCSLFITASVHFVYTSMPPYASNRNVHSSYDLYMYK